VDEVLRGREEEGEAVADLLGGQVGVESRAGEGTRVKVVLPLVSSTAPAGP